jgi:hypothetical protein
MQSYPALARINKATLRRAVKGAAVALSMYLRPFPVALTCRLYLTPYTDHVLDWHTLFRELWGRRGLWLQPADEVSPIWPLDHLTETSQPTDEELTPQLHLEQEQFRFTIRVCARFRAFPTTESSPYANHGATLVLPFHQRVEV